MVYNAYIFLQSFIVKKIINNPDPKNALNRNIKN